MGPSDCMQDILSLQKIEATHGRLRIGNLIVAKLFEGGPDVSIACWWAQALALHAAVLVRRLLFDRSHT